MSLVAGNGDASSCKKRDFAVILQRYLRRTLSWTVREGFSLNELSNCMIGAVCTKTLPNEIPVDLFCVSFMSGKLLIEVSPNLDLVGITSRD